MVDLAIVGAGPAGMAAALEVAEAGFSVLVVDEQVSAGGQIFRRPPTEWGIRHGDYRPYPWARDLIERFENHPRIETLFRATAFGVLRDEREAGSRLRLAVHTKKGGRLVSARHLLIATGAHDMPVAFPGWTLPGVMTAGAVQSLLKSQKLLAKQRLVLAGSHPILLILAAQLLDARAEIIEIAFARGLPRFSEMAAALPAMPGHMALFMEAARALRKIVTHGVRLSHNTIVTKADGGETLTSVRLEKVNSDWTLKGEARTIETDVVALGYGFHPSTELARQAGCDLHWDSAAGGWLVRHDSAFRTSVEGIFVAGEPTGIAGAESAWAEGRVAGLAIAASMGVTASAARHGESTRMLTRARRFSRVVQTMFAPKRTALAALSYPKDTIVCRCELVRSGGFEAMLARNPFIQSASAAKLECRSGMGPCQGRYCEATVAARIALARGTSIEASGRFSAHLPVKPVPLQSYFDLGGGEIRD
ncbi:FAD-dependent oxidoreductase [Ochrobactrum vermis]|uniref:FAD-dependent oxidoreductase n=1 Tax=Ochrobactrum vermis TaxID=1827297 RepID=A0ABU8PFZ5_9HYPH|nr:FAD-dependent oxidoreductase [Ochrobactrum vermis]PQZ25397.1 opine oxidase subunit A [Ochrobactrum vermis]